ncbi:MAG: 16S rRNA (adenine(1518)-N(6)/adenine(1519)-N(6))-dimethyltransferase RsmA [Candidatus Amoebophilus sp.]
MRSLRAKKYLGQHFLQDDNVCKQIVEAFNICVQQPYTFLEIGPGKGALTSFLAQKQLSNLYLVEVDTDLVSYLKQAYPSLSNHIVEADFLTLDLATRWPGPIGIIGNFPYNISSQIFFKILHFRHQVQEVVCMVQKEVAERIVAQPGCKAYGIPSVLFQTFYKIDYLFTVGPELFKPIPKVHSAVIRLQRNSIQQLSCKETTFFNLVKLGFQQRRKKLKNALGGIGLPANIMQLPLLTRRAEELQIEDFINLAHHIDNITV